jgi:hypothetical protein
MQNERQETADPLQEKNDPEIYSQSSIATDTPDHDFEEAGDTDPFISKLAVLQARIAAAEAREATGEEDQTVKILKARKALAEAKAAYESEQQNTSQNLSTSEINSNPSNTAQNLPPSRVLQPRQSDNPLANALQFSSSVCAVIGGVLLSSNTSVSKYGFILLACSSSQIFLASWMLKQKALMIYGGSVFILVDCLGMYRWLIHSSL